MQMYKSQEALTKIIQQVLLIISVNIKGNINKES